jgi:hypothetical protein
MSVRPARKARPSRACCAPRHPQRHAPRRCLGMDWPALGGAFFTETVYGLPGLGPPRSRRGQQLRPSDDAGGRLRHPRVPSSVSRSTCSTRGRPAHQVDVARNQQADVARNHRGAAPPRSRQTARARPTVNATRKSTFRRRRRSRSRGVGCRAVQVLSVGSVVPWGARASAPALRTPGGRSSASARSLTERGATPEEAVQRSSSTTRTARRASSAQQPPGGGRFYRRELRPGRGTASAWASRFGATSSPARQCRRDGARLETTTARSPSASPALEAGRLRAGDRGQQAAAVVVERTWSTGRDQGGHRPDLRPTCRGPRAPITSPAPSASDAHGCAAPCTRPVREGDSRRGCRFDAGGSSEATTR